MAPALLSARYYYNDCNSYNGDGSCYSPWSSYGRWIVVAAVIVAAFFIFLIFACITARRRRRRGMNPYRGTGWASSAPPAGHGPAQYTGGPQQQGMYGNAAAAPPYEAPVNQGYNYGAPDNFGGYGQQNGVELQQPNSAYVRAGENVYAPPQGPPPNKAEGHIIR